jgi:ubiquinone/menaquinone biosynthesis C-methylase UbiE
MKQVNKEHYSFGKYTDLARWSSYYYQIKELLTTEPQTILEIGVGEGVVRDYIKTHTNIAYTTLDVAEDLHPDVVGSVLALPFEDNTFDTVCAFEVLEHLPYLQFETALKELKRVSKGAVILSLPHFGPPVKFLFKIPFVPEIKFAWKLWFYKIHKFDGEHYWEVGKEGYAPWYIRWVLKKYFVVIKDYVPFENQYHHFFVLKNK